MEGKIVYFENPGRENTEEVLRIAKLRAEELGIKTVLVASTTGETAVKAVGILKGLRVVCVSHSTGFHEPADTHRFTSENRKIVESKGGIILITTHAFAGVSRALHDKANRYAMGFGDIIADVLRVFSQGMKVCCEIAMMAADAGLVRCDEDVVCVAGTGRGADTAIVLKPVNSHRFFDLKVREILCKPRL